MVNVSIGTGLERKSVVGRRLGNGQAVLLQPQEPHLKRAPVQEVASLLSSRPRTAIRLPYQTNHLLCRRAGDG